jgi:hypothetical protein
LKAEGDRGAEAENVARGKKTNIIRSDSHNQVLCHINHWLAFNAEPFIIIFTSWFNPGSLIQSLVIYWSFVLKYVYLNFLMLEAL